MPILIGVPAASAVVASAGQLVVGTSNAPLSPDVVVFVAPLSSSLLWLSSPQHSSGQSRYYSRHWPPVHNRRPHCRRALPYSSRSMERYSLR